MKAAFYTLGCKVNQYETQLMRENLKCAGWEIVPHTEFADAYIVNSCTVTAASNSKTRQAVRAFKKKNPQSVVVLAGCMAQAYPTLAKELTQADIIIGNTAHRNISALIKEHLTSGERLIDIKTHAADEIFEGGIIHTFDERTRAAVKIEDGCNRFCSYCAIPYARGRVRSKPIDRIEQEVKELALSGYKEIVLVGINLSAYRDGENDIADALHAAAQKDIARVRLGSLEPDHITDKIIAKLSAEEKFCPQFHISLQSGCDSTLKLMNRHYTAEEYAELCRKLRAAFTDCTLTTDVMVGFPQESDDDFRESYDFVEKTAFQKIHTFPYSRREGTKAAEMDGQIDDGRKAERCRSMIALGEKMRQKFFSEQVGREVEVLFERKRKDGFFEGYTKNYTPVKMKSGEDIEDEIMKVKISSFDKDACIV